MSRLFTKQSFTHAWNSERECERALTYFIDAVDGDVLRIWTDRGKDAVAIIFNGVAEQIYKPCHVTLRRKHTDRYRNALKQFENVIAELQEDDIEVTIFVHPSDEGLINFANPIDTRMEYYALSYTNHGSYVECSPVELAHENDTEDEACYMSLVTAVDSESESTASDDNGIIWPFPAPSDVAKSIENELPTLLQPQTELIRVYRNSTRFIKRPRPCYATVEKCYGTRHKLIDRHGETFAVNYGENIVTRRCFIRDIPDVIKQWNKTCGKDFRFEATAGPNRYFSTDRRGYHQSTLRCCIDCVPSYTFERILDASIALAILDLPVYVILWIIDFLPGTQFTAHIKKLRYIEAIQKSIRKVRESRAQKLKIHLVKA